MFIENIKIKNNINENTKFYPIEIYPELYDIKKYNKKINLELDVILENKLTDWIDWPEKQLYDSEKQIWKIMPLYYYGLWVDKNCDKMPTLTKFLKKLKNMRIALLSILSPNTVLNEHKGWGSHSNKVLRCHYGLKVPNNCYISVKNDDEIIGSIKSHRDNEWIIFDDSKKHFAVNNSNYYRVILIIDLKRPKYLHNGNSDVGDTKELLEIIDYLKKNNE